MNAQEARNKAIENSNKIHGNQYNVIMKQIEQAVRSAKYQLYYNTNVVPTVVQQLRKEGYDLEETHNQHDGYTVIIKW